VNSVYLEFVADFKGCGPRRHARVFPEKKKLDSRIGKKITSVEAA